MSVHDRAVEYRRRLVAVIEASPNRRAACREAGIHHSTFYRWRAEATRDTPHKRVGWSEVLLGRRIVGAALADPAAGPRRIADGLRDAGVVVSASKVWRVLVKHRLNTRQLRYQLLEQHAGGPVPSIVVASTPSRRVGRLDAEVPGDLVQMDCLHIGSFKETKLGRGKHSKGQIWQYTAIDVASSYTWAELHATRHNPDPAITSALAHQVAADLTAWGWTWKAVTTDNGNEYRSTLFRDTIESLGVEHRFIKAGRPQTNGKAERVQGTMIQELYQPALIGYTEPSITGLRRDLTNYLTYYNHHRRHYGRWNQGATPATIITPNPKTKP
jgi:transposase InsO family protein